MIYKIQIENNIYNYKKKFQYFTTKKIPNNNNKI